MTFPASASSTVNLGTWRCACRGDSRSQGWRWTALLLNPGAALGGEEYSWSEGAANSGGGPRLLQPGFSPPGGAQRGLGPEGPQLGGGHGRCSGSQAQLQSWPLGADSPDGLSCGPGSLPRHPSVSRGLLGPSWGWGAPPGWGSRTRRHRGQSETGPGLRRDGAGRRGGGVWAKRCQRHSQEWRVPVPPETNICLPHGAGLGGL